jgi:predicted RNase H-like HicB family nuclease
MLRDYLGVAMHRARYEILPGEGTFYGEIPGFEGVYSEGETLEACRDELEEVLEEWIFVRISRTLPVPEAEGLELRIHEVG